MTILDEIIQFKKQEVKNKRKDISAKDWETMNAFNRKTFSLSSFLTDAERTGIITEFKRKSPSKGMINGHSKVEDVTKGYAGAGASGLSVLTDLEYFGGTIRDLISARENNDIPVLRKEFIIDEYQIIESKAIGADAILLIAACLTEKETYQLARLANELQLQVLFEIHERDELEKLNEYVHIVGVNNRNLKDFTVDINLSIELANEIPGKYLKISESGISNPESISVLKKYGYMGFLIGENFMKEEDPVNAFKDFIKEL